MQTIYLDISNKSVVPTIYAKQGDVGRKFDIVLTDSGLPYMPPSGSVFSVWYSGQSGEGNYTDIGDKSAFLLSGNKVEVEMIVQMLSTHGDGIFCLTLNSPDGNQISSWNIPYLCEKVPGIESEAAKEYYTAFSKSVEGLKQVTENLTPEAIGAAPAGYGLGEERSAMVVATDANLCVKNGWYALWSDTPNGIEAGCVMRVDAEDENNVIQTAFSGHYTNAGLISLQRKKFRGTWDAWEWVNPPMIPGSEYRTTERWNGKPVYTQMRNGLSFPNTSYRDIEFGIVNTAKVIRHRHIAYGLDMCEMPMISGTTVTAYGYFTQSNNGLVYRYKTSTDLTSYTESYIQVWYTKE